MNKLQYFIVNHCNLENQGAKTKKAILSGLAKSVKENHKPLKRFISKSIQK